MDTLESLKQSTPEFFKAYDDNLAALRGLSNILLGQGFIVMINDMAVRPELTIKEGIQRGGHYVLTSATACPIASAPRFTKQDAERLAAGIKNGNGAIGRAVHIRHALSDAIVKHEALIKELAQI